MSDTEAIMWSVEKDPALRSDFCNLTILEHAPDEARVQHTLARAVAAIPRLRQRVVSAPLRIVPPAFADDPTLDLNAHVRRIALPPGDDTDRALLDLCGSLAEQPLDRARPLWEFTLIEGLADGRVALLQKVHHTITDGVGGLRLSLAFVDFEPGEASEPIPTTVTGPIDASDRDHGTSLQASRTAVADATARGVGVARRVVGETTHVLTHPTELPRLAVGTARLARSLQRQVLNTDAGALRRDERPIAHPSLRDVHDLAPGRAGDRTQARRERQRRVRDRLGRRDGSIPRPPRELGRRVTPRDADQYAQPRRRRGQPVRARAVLIPIQPDDDPPTLFARVRDQLTAARNESAIGAAEGLAVLLTPLPTAFLVGMTRAQARTTDFAATNLRGSPVPLYIAGARVLASYPFGPRTNTALNATLLSYGDELNLGLNIDPAAVTDIHAFMADIAYAFEELLALD